MLRLRNQPFFGVAIVRTGLLCALLLAALLVAAPTAAYTLEAILAYPYPTDLSAAPEHERIAWVGHERGVRNIWTAAGPDFEPQRLTDYDQDDGQELGGIAIGPRDRWLVFVRGGNPNRDGEHPNPHSHPEPPDQAVWAVDLDAPGSDPVKLGAGRGPVISPGGERVVFMEDGEIFAALLDGEEREPPDTPLFQARGRLEQPKWSPDGGRVAFVSDRGDHAFVGVYDLAGQAIRWLSPGVDRDSHPAWSPDGKRIAFVRLPGRKRAETLHLMRNQPFQLWVADAATGEGRSVWRSPGEDGFFAQSYADEPLRWSAGGDLLFYSEHEDWLRIYRLDPDAAQPEPRALTPPGCFAEHSDVASDGGTLLFSSNCGDVDRRHVWQTPLHDGRPRLLTDGEGIETDPVSVGGQFVAYRAATWQLPQAVVIARAEGGGARRIWPESLPRDFPAGELVEPRQVIFESSDGLEIHGQLFMPPGTQRQDRPALVFMHGGPIRQMLLGWHYREYYARAYAMNQYLAQRGYVVLSVNFRAGIGYGRDFRLAEDQGPRGASEYQDIRAAGLYLRRMDEVDGERIGLWGGSYGGLLTALGLARDSDLFAAGVDLHGVHDWAFRATDLLPGGAWGIDSDDELKQARDVSPVSQLEHWTSPVLLIHGDDDRNVLFAQTTDLVRRLRERDVHTEVLVFPDEVHSFLRHENWLRAYRATADFFDRFLDPASR
jgi:dipeptidyl aminopeptidase/acylaminoacyl peptidase